MPAFGSTINPALGRTDYAPFLQGSLMGSQMAAKGAENMAGGIASAGQSIGAAIEKYKNDQAQAAIMRGEVEGIMRSNPQVLGKMGEDTQKLFEKYRDNGGSIPLKNLRELHSTLATGVKMAQQDQENQFKEAQQKVALANLAKLQKDAAAKDAANTFLDKFDAGDVPPEIAQNPYFQQLSQIRKVTGETPSADVAAREWSNFSEKAAPKTAAQRDTEETIVAEMAAGRLDPAKPWEVANRRAELMAHGGRDAPERYKDGGIYVNKKDQTDAFRAVQAVVGPNAGQTGTIDPVTKEFKAIDKERFIPITPSDVNAYLDAKAMKDLSDKVTTHENSIRQFNRYIEGVGDLPTGLDKLSTLFQKAFKTSLTKQPLTEEEKQLGLSTARQQGLLGSLRTSVLGPGVLTEIDARRILDRLGGQVESVFTNPEIVKAALGEVLQDKMNEYRNDWGIYDQHVTGRYGPTGYKQRPLIEPYNPPVKTAIEKDVEAEKARRAKAKAANPTR